MSDNIYNDENKEMNSIPNNDFSADDTVIGEDSSAGEGVIIETRPPQPEVVPEEPNFVLVQYPADETPEDEIAPDIDEVLSSQLSEYEEHSAPVVEEIISEEKQHDGAEEFTAENENDSTEEVATEETKEEKYDPRFSKPPRKERKKIRVGKDVGKGTLLVIFCLIFSLLGSYIGGFYGMQKAIENNGGTVLYQSVIRTDDDGNEITSPLSVENTAELVKHSVVEITTETVQESLFIQQYVTEGAGSGVIISEDGYIVTNNHVIEGVSSIKVRTIDGTEYEAKLIGTDSKTDLAVIKVEAEGLNAAVLGSSGSLNVGQSVIAVGNPLGELGGTVTDGIISALEREMTIENQKMNLLQTNAAVNPGNSGGGLFNLYGELVGIVNAKTSGSGIEGLAFAIPIDDAKSVIEELTDLGYVSGRSYMGVTLLDISDYLTAASYRVSRYGVYILEVQEGSPAQKAGIMAGDYVEGIDNVTVKTSSDIIEYVGSRSVGDTVTVYIERSGKGMDIPVILGEYIPTSNIN